MVLVILGWAVMIGPAAVPPDPLASLDVGVRLEEVQRSLARRGVTRPQLLNRETPQALARALVDSGLLEAVNGAGCAPRDREGAFQAGPFARFLLGGQADARYVVSFSGSRRLSFLLTRVKVPVDRGADPKGGWSAKRLHRLRAVLSSLAPYRPRAESRDSYGNVTRWVGRTRRGVVRIRYRPEWDELWVLLAPRDVCRS